MFSFMPPILCIENAHEMPHVLATGIVPEMVYQARKSLGNVKFPVVVRKCELSYTFRNS